MCKNNNDTSPEIDSRIHHVHFVQMKHAPQTEENKKREINKRWKSSPQKRNSIWLERMGKITRWRRGLANEQPECKPKGCKPRPQVKCARIIDRRGAAGPIRPAELGPSMRNDFWPRTSDWFEPGIIHGSASRHRLSITMGWAFNFRFWPVLRPSGRVAFPGQFPHKNAIHRSSRLPRESLRICSNESSVFFFFFLLVRKSWKSSRVWSYWVCSADWYYLFNFSLIVLSFVEIGGHLLFRLSLLAY